LRETAFCTQRRKARKETAEKKAKEKSLLFLLLNLGLTFQFLVCSVSAERIFLYKNHRSYL